MKAIRARALMPRNAYALICCILTKMSPEKALIKMDAYEKPVKPKFKNQAEIILELKEKGFKSQEIADYMGLSVWSIYKRIQRYERRDERCK